MVVYSDTFTRPDTAVGSGLGAIPEGGPAWQVINGSWRIVSNRAYSDTAGSSNPIAVVPSSTGNGDISASVSGLGGDAIYARVTDASNWVRLRVRRYEVTESGGYYVTEYLWKGTYIHGSHNPPVSNNDPSPYYHYIAHSSPSSAPSFPSTISVSHTYTLSGVSEAHTHNYSYSSSTYTGDTRQTYVATTNTYTYYQLVLEKAVAGTVTTIGTANVNQPSSIRLRLVGDVLNAYYNGSGTATITATDAAHQTVAKHGIGRGYSDLYGHAIDNFTLDSLNSPSNASTNLTPSGSAIINRDVTNRFAWSFSDPDTGDQQSAYSLQYRVVGAGAWTTVTGGASQFHDFAAGTFTAGNYEWQVRTTDNSGLVGPWTSSAFFTAAAPPPGPSITAPVNGGTITGSPFLVTWTAAAQDAYQLRVLADAAGAPDTANVLYDTGTVATSGARSRQVDFPTNGITVHVQVRVQTTGLWGDWTSVSASVAFTPPQAPQLAPFGDETRGAVIVDAGIPPLPPAPATFTRASVAHLDGVSHPSNTARFPYGRNRISRRGSAPGDNSAGWADGANAQVTFDPGTVYDGRGTIKVTMQSGGGYLYIAGIDPVRGIDPTKQVTVSMWVRRATAGTVQHFLRWTDHAGGPAGDMQINITVPADTWTRVTTTVTPPGNARSLQLLPHIPGMALGEVFHFTMVQVEVASTASPWRPGGASAVLVEEGTTNLLPAPGVAANWSVFGGFIHEAWTDRLVIEQSAPPAATFSRASTTYLDGVEVASGTPRYPFGRQMLPFANSFADAPTGWIFTLGARAAPTYMTGGVYSFHRVMVYPSTNGDGTVAVSSGVQVKAGVTISVSLYMNRQAGGGVPGAPFPITADYIAPNLVDGTQTGFAATDVGNGWYRVTAQITPSATGTMCVAFQTSDTNNTQWLLEAAQIETGSTVTGWRPGGPSAVLVEEGTTNLLSANQSSLETDTTGWISGGNAVIARSTAQALHGTASLSITAPGPGDSFIIASPYVPVTAGQTYTASVYFRAAATPRTVSLYFRWFNSSNVQISQFQGGFQTDRTTGWTRATFTGVAPAGAVSASVLPYVNGMVANEVHYVDGLQIEQKAYATSWQIGGTARAGEQLVTPPMSTGLVSLTAGCIEVDVVLNTYGIPDANRIVEVKRNGFNGLLIYLSGTSGGTREWRLHVTNDSGTTATVGINATSVPADGRVHRFAMTWGADVGGARFFLDGVQIQGTIALSQLPTTLDVAQGVAIGCSMSSANHFLNNPVDAVRISSRARTVAELADWTTPLAPEAETTYFLDFATALAAQSRVTTIQMAANNGAVRSVSAGTYDPDRRMLQFSGASPYPLKGAGTWGANLSDTSEPAPARAGFQLRGMDPGEVRHIMYPQAEDKPYPTSWTPAGTSRVTDQLEVPVATVSPAAGTIEVDVILQSYGIGANRVFEVRKANGDNGLLIYLDPPWWFLHVTNDAGVAVTRGVNVSSVPAGQAHRFAVSWDSGGILFFVDGVQGETAIPFNQMPSAFVGFKVGSSPSYPGNAINNPVDGVRVSSRARTALELADWTAPLAADGDTTWFQDFAGDLDYATEWGTFNGTETYPDISYGDLFRREVGQVGDGVRVATNLVRGDELADYRVASGREYEYRMRAVGTNGAESWSPWTT